MSARWPRRVSIGHVPRARGSRPPGEMNQTEARYVRDVLEPERASGSIVFWAYESVKLRLGANLHLTPDFIVIRADGGVEFRDPKGFVEEDARAKFKMAASLYPHFRFMLARKRAKKDGGQWEHEEFKALPLPVVSLEEIE